MIVTHGAEDVSARRVFVGTMQLTDCIFFLVQNLSGGVLLSVQTCLGQPLESVL